jgi:hypothetical protein
MLTLRILPMLYMEAHSSRQGRAAWPPDLALSISKMGRWSSPGAYAPGRLRERMSQLFWARQAWVWSDESVRATVAGAAGAAGAAGGRPAPLSVGEAALDWGTVSVSHHHDAHRAHW